MASAICWQHDLAWLQGGLAWAEARCIRRSLRLEAHRMLYRSQLGRYETNTADLVEPFTLCIVSIPFVLIARQPGVSSDLFFITYTQIKPIVTPPSPPSP